jgi:hypothetical protein
MNMMNNAIRSAGFFARNWTMGGPVTLAIYDDEGEGFIGTVSLVNGAWTCGGRSTIREKAQLVRLCNAANKAVR